MKQHDFKSEMRYYIPLFMGFLMMIIGLFMPPVGEISTSVIYAGGMFLILCAAVVGLDIPKILEEIRMIKEASLKHLIEQNKQNKESNQ